MLISSDKLNQIVLKLAIPNYTNKNLDQWGKNIFIYNFIYLFTVLNKYTLSRVWKTSTISRAD